MLGGAAVDDGGDELDEFPERPKIGNQEQTRMVKLCGERVILFDNKTSYVQQQQKQLEKLLGIVDFVIQRNGGKPFSNEMLTQIQEAHDRQKEISIERYSGKDIPQSKEQYDEYLTEITKTVLEKLNSTIESLQKQLLEEQKERQRSEEMRNLIERLEKLTCPVSLQNYMYFPLLNKEELVLLPQCSFSATYF